MLWFMRTLRVVEDDRDDEGRRLLSEAQLPGLQVEATMLEAAERVDELAAAAPAVEAR